MSGRYDIYIVKPNKHTDHTEVRCLCPECADRPSWGVQEMYEKDGGLICSGCGKEPVERRKRK